MSIVQYIQSLHLLNVLDGHHGDTYGPATSCMPRALALLADVRRGSDHERVAGHVAHYHFEYYLGYIDLDLNLAANLSLFSGIGTCKCVIKQNLLAVVRYWI